MSLTHYPHGISSFGVPVLGGGGLMTQGTSYFVNPRQGNDGYDGLTPESAKATVLAAYTLCTANQNDVIYLLSSGNSSGDTTDYWSAKLTWAKNCTHLIGIGSPSMIGHRSRIAQLSTTTGIDGLLTVSGSSCIFANFTVFQGLDDATSENAITVTGDRNYFYNVNVQGLGSTIQAATSGLSQVTLSAAEENTFENCVLGADTYAQGATNVVDMVSDSRDNIFKDCIFLTCGIATTEFVELQADGLLGFTLFKNCTFINAPTAAGAVTAMTLAIGPSRALTATDGLVFMDNCTSTGVTDLGVGGCVICGSNMASATGITTTDIGVGVIPT